MTSVSSPFTFVKTVIVRLSDSPSGQCQQLKAMNADTAPSDEGVGGEITQHYSNESSFDTSRRFNIILHVIESIVVFPAIKRRYLSPAGRILRLTCMRIACPLVRGGRIDSASPN